MKEFIKRHEVVSYLLIVFIGIWVIYTPLLIYYGDRITPTSSGVIPISLFIGIFPSISALLLTYIKEGKIKNSALIKSIKKKSSAKLYLIVLMIMPFYMLLKVLLSSLFVTSCKFNIQPGVIVLALTWGIFAAFGEEFGWRGLLLPACLKKYTLLQSGLLVGVIWGLWHIPMNYIGAVSKESDLGLYILFPTLELILDSSIITGIYAMSNGNLKTTMVFHYTTVAMAIFEGEIWKPVGVSVSHLKEFSISMIGLIIRLVFVVFMYCFIRKRIRSASSFTGSTGEGKVLH